MGLGLVDRAIALISPRAALKRVTARAALMQFTAANARSYDAARPGSRATWGWFAGPTSANAELFGSLQTLRDRSRDLVRNNGHAAKAIRVLTNNVVGTGLTAQARTPDKLTNEKIDRLWLSFCEECDFAGQLNFDGLQRLAIRCMLEGAETVVRLVPVKGRKTAVPLELQLLEGDYIDHRRTAKSASGGVYQGIEFDAEGRRSGYWLFKEHPGEIAYFNNYQSERIPASSILHLYEILRIGQIRGVPWLVPGMVKARELDTYDEAELVRKRIEACVAAIVMGVDDENEASITGTAGGAVSGPTVRDAAGRTVEEFTPGLIAIARGTKDIKFTAPAQNGSYPEYKRTQLQSLSAAWDMTYELLSGDLSRVNYSSIKAGINEFRRSVEVLQWLTFIPMFMTPIWRAFIDHAVLVGRLPAKTSYDVEFSTPKFEAVDPLKETEADIAAVRALMLSPQEALKRRGFDPDQIFDDSLAWHQKLVAAKVSSDADPTLSPKAGAAQPASSSSSSAADAGSADAQPSQ